MCLHTHACMGLHKSLLLTGWMINSKHLTSGSCTSYMGLAEETVLGFVRKHSTYYNSWHSRDNSPVRCDNTSINQMHFTQQYQQCNLPVTDSSGHNQEFPYAEMLLSLAKGPCEVDISASTWRLCLFIYFFLRGL